MAEKTVPVATEKQAVTAREDIRESERYLAPPVDIYETPDGLVVVADMPGVEKDSLGVRVEDNILTLEGKVCHTSPGQPVWSEYELVNFYRRFELTDEVDQDKIKAEYKHGVLTIHLPKVEQAKPRKIRVNVA
ncbi:MAG: Hsp20/alpha crystallin family protein [Candidatus Sumerlaeia bacterium]|nr:Hsp20/alpha crystallin family protein [Candidatus Sumerlaeia bacterium]